MTRINMATEPTYRLHPRTGRSRTCGAAAVSILLGIRTEEVLAEWRRVTCRQRCSGMKVEDILFTVSALGYHVHGTSDCNDATKLDPHGRYVLIMRDRPHAVAMADGHVQDNGSYYPTPVPVAEMAPISAVIEIGEPRACW